MADPTDPLYRVVEVGIDGVLEPEVTAGVKELGYEQIRWNRKHRIYPRYQEAKVYRDRLLAQDRKAKILKFVFEGEVD